MENRSSNFLARFFDWNREIIEAAETPFSKLAVFILPILAPLVPAFMTTMHLQKLLEEIFSFNYALQISWVMSITTGLVLELLGYVGAITFIRSLFQYVRSRNESLLLPVVLNGLAYVFYVVAMWLINYQLGKYFETPPIINGIFGLLSFITIPTGLLAANHLSQRDEDDKTRNDKEREIQLSLQREEAARNERLRIAELKSNERIAKAQFTDTVTPNRRKPTKTNWTDLTQSDKDAMRTMTHGEIMQKYGVSKGTAHNWKQWSK